MLLYNTKLLNCSVVDHLGVELQPESIVVAEKERGT